LRHRRQSPGSSRRSGYGPTIRADAVKALVDSVINFQERSLGIVAEMRVWRLRIRPKSATPWRPQPAHRQVGDGRQALGLNG